MRKTIVVTGRYVWIPIKIDVTDTSIAFYLEGEKIQEIYIGITDEKPDFYAWFDAKEYLGKISKKS